LNLELGPKSSAALDQLQSALETSGQADTIRLSLQTLAKLVEETKAGGRVIIENGKDRIEVLLPLLHPAQAD
jgi:hypothetical protein